MAFIIDDASSFASDSLRGLSLAHPDLLKPVTGGVVRRSSPRAGNVAVVIGGGTGHYPAFAGFVGDGLAHGAVVGDVFASPSAEAIVSVATACESGGGVLLCFGNYAGDVLNFEDARQRLEGMGVATRTMAVTDDVASAPSGHDALRRGVAGDLIVFKIASAAADSGLTLDQVHSLARSANSSTRTVGLAFSGCTLPGSSSPLFVVPPGKMAVGMGIHGEPGLGEQDLIPASSIAQLLVDRVVAERPCGRATAAAVLLNSLGGIGGEELYLLYGAVHGCLQAAGIDVATADVGEFATSFRMAGVSLTVAWLDAELLGYWRSDCRAPGFRRQSVDWLGHPDSSVPRASVERPPRFDRASGDSRIAAKRILAGFESAAATIGGMVDELGRLDAIAGDGDHGIGMQRGVEAASEAAAEALRAGAGARSVLKAGARAWAARAGGTSGALWGAMLTAAADTLDDESAILDSDVVRAMAASEGRLVELGGARPGDKTMLDSLDVFVERLTLASGNGTDLSEAWAEAANAAIDAANRTAAMIAKTGRARAHGAKSLGSPDPGAISLAAILRALATTSGDERLDEPSGEGGTDD